MPSPRKPSPRKLYVPVSRTLRAAAFASALIAVQAATPAAHAADDAALAERTEKARGAVQTLMKNLGGQLKAAMKEGGPIKAIGVCKDVAPSIAGEVSQSMGFDVARTALKVRNPDNAPDDFERAALEEFAAAMAGGADPAKLEKTAVVDTDGGRLFRYMKAIPMSEKPCMACHGGNIAPDVSAKIDELYPKDEAVGFKPGDLRGAFTITQKLD